MCAPIGDADFEEAFYETKATVVVSKIIDTTEMLHDRSAAAAHHPPLHVPTASVGLQNAYLPG